MIQDVSFYIIGIDGGASKTQGILFTETGQTLCSIIEGPSNLTLNAEAATDCIQYIINSLCSEAKIPIENIDATIILQEPALSSSFIQMRENIATILSSDLDQISIKATTTDKMGFIGKGEGIAAITSVLVKK